MPDASARRVSAHTSRLEPLVSWQAGISAFLTVPDLGSSLASFAWKALVSPFVDVGGAAMEVLAALLNVRSEPPDLTQEQACKKIVLGPDAPRQLVTLLKMHLLRGTGALLLAHVLEGVCFILCRPQSDTTEPDTFRSTLGAMSGLGQSFFKLFNHPCILIPKCAGLVMQAIVEDAEPDVVTELRQMALTQGAFLEQLYSAFFGQGRDSRSTFQRELSQNLVGYWASGHPTTLEMLGRVVPPSLLRFLACEMEDQPERPQTVARESWWRRRRRSSSGAGVNNRKSGDEVAKKENWPMLFQQFHCDHARPDLIWNQRTRDELKEAMMAEIRDLRRAQQMASERMRISWNHQEFSPRYPSLAAELKVGEVFLRVLLDGSPKQVQLHNPGRFFDELYHRLLWETAHPVRLLTLQGMAVTYSNYHEAIGRFPDMGHILRLVQRCTSRAERDRLLLLVSAMLSAPCNYKPFIEAGGLPMLVAMLTTVHMETERSAHSQVLQTNLLSMSGESGAMKEWYVQAAPDDDDEEQEQEEYGPYDMEELAKFFRKQGGGDGWLVWAQGVPQWVAPHKIPHVKWGALADDEPLLTYTQLGSMVLDLMLEITAHYPTHYPTDGALIHPMPTPKRELSAAGRLPHLVQLLLTMEPSIVERSAELLERLVESNPTLPRLYLSGAFFFAFMYTGSNIRPIISFLQVAHKNQSFTEEGSSDGLSSRSFLGLMLPQAMVCCLENHGVDKFAEIFLGDFDTPEYIWNHSMRRFMIEKIAIHVGDMPVRLQANSTALYQYCPMPRIVYPELNEEIFCHRYYLRHLCDTDKYGEWPIEEPIPLLQAILATWATEVQKKPSSMSREDAMRVLGMDPTAEWTPASDTILRRAYHKMAARYHPDKNSDAEAREIFEQVQKAYEMLVATGRYHAGPDPHNIALLLQGQVIVYTRYSSVLAPFKYAGYPLLIQVLRTVDDEGHDLPDVFAADNARLLVPAVKLLDATIETAPLNAHELQRVGGVEVLISLFRRCVSQLTPTSELGSVPVDIVLPLLRTITGIAPSPECRVRLGTEDARSMLMDVVRCLHFLHLPHVCEAAMKAISLLCVDEGAQGTFVEGGVVWHLVQLLTKYDFTLEEAGVEAAADSNIQQLANFRSKLAVAALQRIAGYPGAGTHSHSGVQHALNSLLTGYMAGLLCTGSSVLAQPVELGGGGGGVHTSHACSGEGEQLLRLLNSSSETPYLLWNSGLRGELINFISNQLQLNYASPSRSPLEAAEEFEFEGLSSELKVGTVYVRIYNAHPSYPLHDAPEFCAELIMFLARRSGRQVDAEASEHARAAIQQPQVAAEVAASLQAMLTLLQANFNLEEQLLTPGSLDVLLSFANEGNPTEVLTRAVEVGCACTANSKCIAAIAEGDAYLHLFPLLRLEPNHLEALLKLFTSLATQPKVASRFLSHGALLHVLYLFASTAIAVPQHSSAASQGSKMPWTEAQRAAAGSLLARIATNRAHGPKVMAFLKRLMPIVFMSTMSEDAIGTVRIFDAAHENPELIWGDAMRAELQAALEHLSEESMLAQRANPLVGYQIPEDCHVEYPQLTDELCIGGIYIRLLLEQPAWQLHNPKAFLEALLQAWSQMVAQDAPDMLLGQTSQALVVLLQANPSLHMQVGAFGYLPKIVAGLAAERNDLQKSCAHVLRQICESGDCVHGMRALDCIKPMTQAMQTTPSLCDQLVPTLVNLMSESDLVEKALAAELVPFTLKLLSGGLGREGAWRTATAPSN